MPIAFNEIPANVLVPNVYIEVDNSRADQAPSIQPYKVLAIGQRLSAGTVAAGVLKEIAEPSQAREYFGAGSNLAEICAKVREVNRAVELFAVALDDDGAGVAATATITITGTATENGTLYVWVADRRYTVAALTTDTPTTLAAAIVTAIQADADRIVTATSLAGVVTLTMRSKGSFGNEVKAQMNYYSDEVTPAGLTVVVTAFGSGATNPAITPALATLTEDQYNLVAMPYTDANNLAIFDNEMDDRFGPIRQNFGVGILAKRDTFSNLSTFADPKNSKNYCVMGIGGPSSTWQWAGQIAGRTALAAQIDPARPLQTLSLPTILPPKESEQFTWTERQNLLQEGISTYQVVGDTVNLERIRTLYKQNAFGADDQSFGDIETLLTLEYLRYDLKNNWLRTYPRAKLANDGTNFGPGQDQVIVTPKLAKAFLCQLFRQWEFKGLVEDFEQFKRDLVVERNISDRNRLDILLPPNIINQLRVAAFQLQFRL